MPRLSQPEIARLNRDAALARLRRLTVSIGLAALGLTAAASLVAATSNPGRSTSAQSSASNPGPSDNGSSQGDQSQQGLNPPDQPPQAGGNVGPSAVSGGS